MSNQEERATESEIERRRRREISEGKEFVLSGAQFGEFGRTIV